MKYTILPSSTLWLMVLFIATNTGCTKQFLDTPPEEKTSHIALTSTGPTPPRGSGMIKYHPALYNMWDSWTIMKGDTAHLFHLQGTRAGQYYPPDSVNLRGFGHAVSTDLVHWTERKEVLTLYGKTLDNDWDFRYTGSTIKQDSTYYMFYTMRKWAGQRIGVATSSDLYNWTEYTGNPVLVPDEEWFVTFSSTSPGSNNPIWGDIIDCRDMLVVKDETGSGYYGYFVASTTASGFTTPTSAVGVAYSYDLLNWEQQGIAYAPTGVSMPEMMDIFKYQGNWYMTLTTAKNNGSLSAFSDHYMTRAITYAVASSPTGPFVEDPNENVLFGGQLNSGYSARTVNYYGKRRMMYVDTNNGNSVLSLPKTVGKNAAGKLRLYYADDLLGNIREQEIGLSILTQPNNSFAWPTRGGNWTLVSDTLRCTTDPNSWQAAILGGEKKNMEISYTVSASSCESHGIVFADSTGHITLNNLKQIFIMEPSKNRAFLTDHLGDFKNARSYTFPQNESYTVRALLLGNTLEVYINDEFVFNSGIYNPGKSLSGVFANNGSITLADVKLFELEE